VESMMLPPPLMSAGAAAGYGAPLQQGRARLRHCWSRGGAPQEAASNGSLAAVMVNGVEGVEGLADVPTGLPVAAGAVQAPRSTGRPEGAAASPAALMIPSAQAPLGTAPEAVDAPLGDPPRTPHWQWAGQVAVPPPPLAASAAVSEQGGWGGAGDWQCRARTLADDGGVALVRAGGDQAVHRLPHGLDDVLQDVPSVLRRVVRDHHRGGYGMGYYSIAPGGTSGVSMPETSPATIGSSAGWPCCSALATKP